MSNQKTNLKKYAIFTSAGDRSSHRSWFCGERNFDLFMCYYGDEPGRYYHEVDWYYERKGTKTQNLFYSCQESEFGTALFDHDYILSLDDDFQISATNLSRFFEICAGLQAWIAQPAVTGGSFCPHKITRQVFGMYARATNFVECCAPCFERDVFQKVFPYFQDSVSGWGIDYWWWKCLGEPTNRFFIIDATPAFHPRRYGENPSELDKYMSRKAQEIEGTALMDRLGIGPYEKVTFLEIPENSPRALSFL
jgi:hypothetical protein